MALVLCKYWSNTTSNDNYGEVGERINPIYWDSSTNRNGFCGLREGNGNWAILELEGDCWLVVDADDQIIDIEGPLCKFNTGIVLFRGTSEELSKTDYCHKMAIDSESAFTWARDIGNKDVMINRINDSKYAFYWGFYIGNQNVMINKIDNSEDAYNWAFYIGDDDLMISKITESGDAYMWAKDIGNLNIMKPKITKDYWINKWNETFKDSQIEV